MVNEAAPWAPAFRKAVRAALVALEMREADLARELGWSSGRLSNYMTGKRKPSMEDTWAIADALRLDRATLTSTIGLSFTEAALVEIDVDVDAAGADLDELRRTDPEYFEKLMQLVRTHLRRQR